MAEQNALQAFASVPKLIMTILEFIMKMKESMIASLKEKIEDLNLQLEHNKTLSEEDKKKLLTKITNLKGTLAEITKERDELKEALEDPTGGKLANRPECQALLNELNDMKGNTEQKNNWFDEKGDLKKEGVNEFIKRANNKLNLKLPQESVQKVINFAQERVNRRNVEVRRNDPGKSNPVKPSQGLSVR